MDFEIENAIQRTIRREQNNDSILDRNKQVECDRDIIPSWCKDE